MMSRSVCKVTLVIALLPGLLGRGAPGTLAYQSCPNGLPHRDVLDTLAATGQFSAFVRAINAATYEAADMISRNDFGHGAGIVPLRFVDDTDLEGDYTVFLQVKRLP